MLLFVVIAKPFRQGRQEDAHEFLRYFVDALQKSCLQGLPSNLDPHSKATTVVHKIFGGYHRSQGEEGEEGREGGGRRRGGEEGGGGAGLHFEILGGSFKRLIFCA